MADSRGELRIEAIVLVAVGGFFGSTLRFFVGQFEPGIEGTLFVNALGSLLLGILVYESLGPDLLDDLSRRVLGTGVLSSFTTYSTFALETVQAEPLVGLLNVVGSYGLGFAGVLIGREIAGMLEGYR